MTLKSAFGPHFKDWRSLEPPTKGHAEASVEEVEENGAAREIKSTLLSSLQMQHIVALAGSGTSLGTTGGPSMWSLWDHCVNSNAGSQNKTRTRTPQASDVISSIGYRIDIDGENIESLLSRCDAYLQIKQDDEVSEFVKTSKAVILEMCSSFLRDSDQANLESHRLFLHRLSRRRTRDSRMKLFTTNYDLCFELAAGRQGLIVIDGFSFSFPRIFDPRLFSYDIVRRPATGEETASPLEGVFHLFKLHGSVNWDRTDGGEVLMRPATGDTACLIYPARGKYQQSYVQPHLELMSQYLSAIRQPNTCLIVTGFGFNDDHLSEPILASARTNPHLRLIVVDPNAEKLTSGNQGSKYWRELYKMAQQGSDVWLINATFGQFAELIPDLRSLTPGDRLIRDIKMAAGN